MRIKEVLKEADLAPATGVVPGQAPGQEGQDIGKLTASISALQKQIQDLQKASLQQSASTDPSTQVQNSQAQPKPGEAGQSQAAQGTVAPGQQTQAPAQPGRPAPAGGLGQPNGVPMGQPPAANPVVKPAAGVNQPPQITNMKIKQQLAQNQGKGA
jgi:hypothetical protein